MFDNYVYCASTMKVEGIIVDVAERESEIEKKVENEDSCSHA